MSNEASRTKSPLASSFLRRLSSNTTTATTTSDTTQKSPTSSTPPRPPPLSRLQTAGLTLLASVSTSARRRTTPTSPSPTSPPRSIARSPSSFLGSSKKIPSPLVAGRPEAARSTFPQKSRARPLSHAQLPVIPDDREAETDADEAAMRKRRYTTLGNSVLSDGCSSEGGSSTCSSVQTLSQAEDDDDEVETVETGRQGQFSVTPAKSCSSIYPSLDTRMRGPRSPNHKLPSSIKTLQRQLSTDSTNLSVASSTAGSTTSTTSTTGSSSVFGRDPAQRKEIKAIALWRNTVAHLLQQNNDHAAAKKQKSVDQRSLSKAFALTKFITLELYTTEQNYHRLLTVIKTRYMTPMLAASQTKNPLVKMTDIPILFRHLSEMIATSEKLLCKLDLHMSRLWRPDVNSAFEVGHIFCALEEDLAVFVRYAVHYQANIKSIRRACNNVLVLKIEQESMSRRDTNRMGIADYLIAPFQRVPRYCLLIKDLLKYTRDSHHSHHAKDLMLAFKTLTALAIAMDHVQKPPRMVNNTAAAAVAAAVF